MAKTKSFGTTVGVGTDPTYADIGSLTDINITGGDVPTNDATAHDSTAKEYTAGLLDNGTLEINGYFDASDAGQDALRAAIGTEKDFLVTLPNSATIKFAAIVGVPNETVPLEGTVGFSLSCKITGAKTYSAT